MLVNVFDFILSRTAKVRHITLSELIDESRGHKAESIEVIVFISFTVLTPQREIKIGWRPDQSSIFKSNT